MERAVFVYTTYPSVVEAERAGRVLVERRLCACVNILPGMISLYWWQGAIERGDEVVMIIKDPRKPRRSRARRGQGDALLHDTGHSRDPAGKCRPGLSRLDRRGDAKRGLASAGGLIRHCAVNDVLEHLVGAAIGIAANQPHLFQIVLGFEHIALFGLPHAVIRPGHGMVGIGGKCALVPEFGVVVAAELAAGVTEQRRYVGVVVVAERAQRGDAGNVVVLVVDQRVGGMVAAQEILRRTALVVIRLWLVAVLGFRSSFATALRSVAAASDSLRRRRRRYSGATRTAENSNAAASESDGFMALSPRVNVAILPRRTRFGVTLRCHRENVIYKLGCHSTGTCS